MGEGEEVALVVVDQQHPRAFLRGRGGRFFRGRHHRGGAFSHAPVHRPTPRPPAELRPREPSRPRREAKPVTTRGRPAWRYNPTHRHRGTFAGRLSWPWP